MSWKTVNPKDFSPFLKEEEIEKLPLPGALIKRSITDRFGNHLVHVYYILLEYRQLENSQDQFYGIYAEVMTISNKYVKKDVKDDIFEYQCTFGERVSFSLGNFIRGFPNLKIWKP